MFNFETKKVSLLRILWLLSIPVFLFLLLPYTRKCFFDHIGRWLYIFLFSLSLTATLTPLMRTIALKLNIVDAPGGRKIHEKSTPLLGGVAIIIAFLSALISNMILDKESVILLTGAIIVALVSLVDDWKGLSARFKLFVQIIVVLTLIYFGIILDLFPPRTTWGYILNVIFTIL